MSRGHENQVGIRFEVHDTVQSRVETELAREDVVHLHEIGDAASDAHLCTTDAHQGARRRGGASEREKKEKTSRHCVCVTGLVLYFIAPPGT